MSAPPLPSGWACEAHRGVGRHTAFVSCRAASEGPAGNGLVGRLIEALERDAGGDAGGAAEGAFGGTAGGAAGAGSAAAAPASLSVFYGARCLGAHVPWEVGLKNGLEGAALVLPLVSAAALQDMAAHAATRRDRLLSEWELSLSRQRRGLCLLLPIFVHAPDARGQPQAIDFREVSYPDRPHFLSGASIRSTFAALFKVRLVPCLVPWWPYQWLTD